MEYDPQLTASDTADTRDSNSCAIMRLLEIKGPGEFSLVQVASHTDLSYAILSHTWTDGQEVTYQDLVSGAGNGKSGYDKIKFCGEQAAKDGQKYFWVDTCCIDKSDADELSTAINSMFRWYRNAKRCYVYLTDVPAPAHDGDVQPGNWLSGVVDGLVEAGRFKSL